MLAPNRTVQPLVLKPGACARNPTNQTHANPQTYRAVGDLNMSTGRRGGANI
jgi:hypothetical protein